jgi:hypothetical protein
MANSETGRAAGTLSGATLGPQLLNEYQAAETLGIKVATLRRWRWSGKSLRFLKIGSAVRYEPAELSAFIERARRTSTSDPGQGVAA